MGRRPRILERDLLPLIRPHRGNLTRIAAELGVTRTAVRAACDRFEPCQIALGEVREGRLDKAQDIFDDALDADEQRDRWAAAMHLLNSPSGRIRLFGRDEQTEFLDVMERLEKALGMARGFDPREL